MIDLTYLNITTGNDTGLIAQLIAIFSSQLPDFKKLIQSTFKENNWPGLKEAAHKAKNSFEIIGAKEEAQNLKKIEMIAASETNLDELDALIENFLDSCKKVTEEIEQLKL